MAMNSSSCSVLPVSVHADGVFTSTMTDGSTRWFEPFWINWEEGSRYRQIWEDYLHRLNLDEADLYRLHRLAMDYYGYGRMANMYDSLEADMYDSLEADMYGSYDPVDLLPSDPFDMDICTAVMAELDGWIEDLGARPCDYEGGGDGLITGLSHYCDRALASASEPRSSFGGIFDGGATEGFSGLSRHDAQDGVAVSAEVVEDFSSSAGAEAEAAEHVGGDGSGLHEGLYFALGFLDVKDLLSVEMVCRSLCSTVKNDTLLWRCIHIDSPLRERLTDNALLRLTQRAQGSLQCLSMVSCSRITDDGLKRVLECNPRLKKLSVHGCLRLSIDGLINNLKAFNPSATPGIKCLKLGWLFGVSARQFEELKLLVDGGQTRAHKPRFFHRRHAAPLACDEEQALDVEMCPVCQKFKLIYDCSSESCQEKGPAHCRACEVCIERCTDCGRCINNRKYIETFLLDYVCSDCWKHPPNCPERVEER